MTGFFFNPAEVATPKQAPKRSKLLGCSSCRLSLRCHSPKMEAFGKNKLHIAIVAEAPGKEEDAQGKPLVGDSGRFLRQRLAKYGIDMDADCIRTNVVQCRPPNNREPSSHEILCCRSRLERQLKEGQPDLIFAFGTPAVAEILRDCPKNKSATAMIGRIIPCVRYKCWVAPCFHPAWFLRQKHKYDAWLDMVIVSGLDKLCEGKWKEQRLDPKGYTVATTAEQIANVLDSYGASDTPVAFDYETTGLNPWHKEARLLTAAVSRDPASAIAFPLEHKEAGFGYADHKLVFDALRRWLQSPCPKVIQNWQFEEIWSRVLLGVGINNVVADTMLREHVLDNRAGVCGQDFQEFVRWGEYGHKASVDQARLADCFLDTVLRYNALDVRYAIRWYYEQEAEMKRRLEADKLLV